MPKYYYTCPIKALYMHKEFNVKLLSEVCIKADLTKNNSCKNMTPNITKIYVSAESKHIFESKEGDIVDGLRIIMRNNKFFFMPEVEND